MKIMKKGYEYIHKVCREVTLPMEDFEVEDRIFAQYIERVYKPVHYKVKRSWLDHRRKDQPDEIVRIS